MASMGLRFFKRRNAPPSCRLSSHRASFNGAALFQAQKFSYQRLNKCGFVSFNGAALFQAQKLRLAQARMVPTTRASMGLRFFKRRNNNYL